jgi:exodeoxyribonuclease VII large subunit
MLALQFELLRQKLEAEGLFDVERKRPLPLFPKAIAVVTSAEGAVWQDIQSILRRRFPLVHLILSAAPVQGDSAPEGIVAALERVQTDGRAELVIVARGGGSAEDLSWFNDERIARAIFACRIPVVSAVGHETDWTIADLVADLRAPTPSAAAELCTPSIVDLMDDVQDCIHRSVSAATNGLMTMRTEGADFERRVARLSPAIFVAAQRTELDRQKRSLRRASSALIAAERTTADSARQSLEAHITGMLTAMGRDLERSAAVLDALNPSAILARGYAAIEDGSSGKSITAVAALHAKQSIRARFADGAVTAVVDRVDVNDGVGQNGD